MWQKYLIGLVAAGGAAGALADAPLTVAWREKPPYYYFENGVAKGFMLERAKQVFAAARVQAQFVNEPQKRIWANFAHGMQNYCSISWYRLPEREAVAQYSVPIHADQPHAVLAVPAVAARIKSHTNLKSLLADQTLTLGVIDGVSYGPELDALIAGSQNRIMRRTVETAAMFRMVSVGRADYMFVDREDWNYLRVNHPELRTLVLVDYSDMPPGLKRHIVCSRDVPTETMERLNRAIAARNDTPHR
ncbi:substrate-binding periplasmic protein [Pseudoduganella violaceinigra]|uniref:substrate-binding periplasmic protein n=1 Tax=Pseudoduganella violaceinigra TaxID=246602 RepID=UPI0003F7CCDC|nr:transporter substrate-binding domain-containing protein [Pseudoduganella violaceinigra]